MYKLISLIHLFSVWDQRKWTLFKFVYFDCTTYTPYTEEISYENSLLVHQTSTLGLASLAHVFASLTFNAKAIFIVIAKRQLDNKDDSNYQGIINYFYCSFR